MAELAEKVAAFAGALDARLKGVQPAARRLSRVDAAQLATLRGLSEVIAVLRAAPLDAVGLGAERGELVTALEAARAELGQTKRRGFHERFRAVFGEAGAAPVVKAENPPEYRLGRLHAILDFEAETAQLLFARLPVERDVALDPDALAAAWRNALERLGRASVEPARFAPQVAGAYRALLARKGKPAGERVEIADLYAEVAFALQPDRFREDVDKRTLVPYPRAQFVWDLLRWRAEGALAIGEQRADLGVAVAGAAMQKKRAFWLEDEAGAGMFYTSFRLVEQT
jgi:hypothetical protein